MDELEEFNLINRLYDEYGSLLSSTQSQMMEQYYVYNLSLGEIAEAFEISRTAVNDAIKKGVAKCYEFEDKMHNVALKDKINEILASDKSQEEKLESIKGVIDNGI